MLRPDSVPYITNTAPRLSLYHFKVLDERSLLTLEMINHNRGFGQTLRRELNLHSCLISDSEGFEVESLNESGKFGSGKKYQSIPYTCGLRSLFCNYSSPGFVLFRFLFFL